MLWAWSAEIAYLKQFFCTQSSMGELITFCSVWADLAWKRKQPSKFWNILSLEQSLWKQNLSLHIVPDVTLLDIVKNSFIKCKNIFNKSNVDIKKTPSTSVKVISHKSSRTGNSPVIPLKANPTKWSNILKQFVGKLFGCVWSFCRFGT